MARGGARVGAGRPKTSRASKEPAKKEVRKQGSRDGIPSAAAHDASGAKLTPLDYMLKIMNSDEADDGRRDRMAVAAAPFVHTKMGEGGKKEQKQEAAKTAARSKFAPAAAPKLVVNNK